MTPVVHLTLADGIHAARATYGDAAVDTAITQQRTTTGDHHG